MTALDARDPPTAAFPWLGIWASETSVSAVKSRFNFPAKGIRVAARCLDSPPLALSRCLDLKHLKVYTIDDEYQ